MRLCSNPSLMCKCECECVCVCVRVCKQTSFTLMSCAGFSAGKVMSAIKFENVASSLSEPLRLAWKKWMGRGGSRSHVAPMQCNKEDSNGRARCTTGLGLVQTCNKLSNRPNFFVAELPHRVIMALDVERQSSDVAADVVDVGLYLRGSVWHAGDCECACVRMCACATHGRCTRTDTASLPLRGKMFMCTIYTGGSRYGGIMGNIARHIIALARLCARQRRCAS